MDCLQAGQPRRLHRARGEDTAPGAVLAASLAAAGMTHDTHDMPLAHNALKARLARGQVAMSLIVRSARGPEIALVARSSGFDALYIDLEHSPLSLDTASMLCIASQAAGVTPLVRVPEASAARSEEHTSELQSLMRIS